MRAGCHGVLWVIKRWHGWPVIVVLERPSPVSWNPGAGFGLLSTDLLLPGYRETRLGDAVAMWPEPRAEADPSLEIMTGNCDGEWRWEAQFQMKPYRDCGPGSELPMLSGGVMDRRRWRPAAPLAAQPIGGFQAEDARVAARNPARMDLLAWSMAGMSVVRPWRSAVRLAVPCVPDSPVAVPARHAGVEGPLSPATLLHPPLPPG